MKYFKILIRFKVKKKATLMPISIKHGTTDALSYG